jgi:sporulation protein YlmC with PRC-barrel domain
VNKLILLPLIAALALGRTAHPQAQVPPDPGVSATPGTTNPSKSDPSTTTPGVVSPGPAPTDPTSRAERPTSRSDPAPSRSPTRLAEPESAGKLSVGTVVQSPAGAAIGTVQDLVSDPRTGQPSYVVVNMRSGANAPIPYSTIAPMFSNGRVILDQSRLEEAPRVSNSQLRNPSDHTWQQKSEKYWNARGPKSR